MTTNTTTASETMTRSFKAFLESRIRKFYAWADDADDSTYLHEISVLKGYLLQLDTVPDYVMAGIHDLTQDPALAAIYQARLRTFMDDVRDHSGLPSYLTHIHGELRTAQAKAKAVERAKAAG